MSIWEYTPKYAEAALSPFSPEPGAGRGEDGESRAGATELEALLKFGGFPEPLFRQDEAEHRIWQRDRIARVVREDLRDLEHVREISLIEHLVELLPSRVHLGQAHFERGGVTVLPFPRFCRELGLP